MRNSTRTFVGVAVGAAVGVFVAAVRRPGLRPPAVVMPQRRPPPDPEEDWERDVVRKIVERYMDGLEPKPIPDPPPPPAPAAPPDPFDHLIPDIGDGRDYVMPDLTSLPRVEDPWYMPIDPEAVVPESIIDAELSDDDTGPAQVQLPDGTWVPLDANLLPRDHL